MAKEVLEVSSSEIRDFSYISGVFKYIESYHLMGHQIGRKVGDMLELIVMGKIFSDPELRKKLFIEPKVYGATGAGHKVEFGFYESPEKKKDHAPFGIIECKKVGIEVTKSSSIRSDYIKLKSQEDLDINFTPGWFKKGAKFKVKVNKIEKDVVTVELFVGGASKGLVAVGKNQTLKLVIDEKTDAFIFGPLNSLRDVEKIIRFCKILKLEDIETNSSTWGVYDCLTGPQTIEKAKQAALVAMDVRKKVDGKWGKDDLAENEKKITSILVITEASHWESKSRKVITTCIDHNLIVPDEVIVTAFQLFEEKFGTEKMLPYITKSMYADNVDVQLLIDKVVKSFSRKLFYDLDLGTFADFVYENGKLVVKPVS